jgi:predicted DNA-binding transcriptional regulator AlpA
MPSRRRKDVLLDFTPADRFIGEAEREYMTDCPRQSWLRLEQTGQAPKRIKFGAQRVAWLESEILAWMRARAAERDRPAGEVEAEQCPGDALAGA